MQLPRPAFVALLASCIIGAQASAQTVQLQPSCSQEGGFTSALVPVTLKIDSTSFRRIVHILCNDVSERCDGFVLQLPDDRASSTVSARDIYPMQELRLVQRSDRMLMLSWGPANTFVLNLKTSTLQWTQSDGASGTGSCK